MGELGSIWFLALVFGSKLGRNRHLEIWRVLDLHIVAPFFFFTPSGNGGYLVAHPTARKWVITPVISGG